MGVVASAVLPLSLLAVSCELKWGLSSIIGVGGSLGSSFTCSRTGILPTLPPPTTGILLSPEALTDVGFFSLGGSAGGS